MDEEAQTSLIAGRTPWPAGLRSIEEKKKKEEEEHEQETRRQLQEQDRRQEPQELEEQQQQGGQPLEGPLEPPPHSPPQPVPLAPQEPGDQEEGLPVFGPPTLAWLRLGVPAAIPAESGRADGVVALACMMRTPSTPSPR